LLQTIKKKEMKKNMGTIDKSVRIVLAIVAVVLFFTHVVSGVLGIVLLVVAGIFVLTSLISFCPLYWPFGINTSKKKE
jgi:Flp pilus assembly protein TadB